MQANSLELSGQGTPDRHLFYLHLSYNFAAKSRSIPGPFQRVVMLPFLSFKAKPIDVILMRINAPSAIGALHGYGPCQMFCMAIAVRPG